MNAPEGGESEPADDDLEGVDLLLLHGSGVDFGVESASVREVVSQDAWQGAPPVRADGTLPPASEAGGRRTRVVVVRTRGGEVALAAGSDVRVHRVPRSRICPLPREVLARRAARMLSGIVFRETSAPVLILDGAFLDALRLGRSAP